MNEAEALANVLDLTAGYEIRMGETLSIVRLDQEVFLVEYESTDIKGEPVMLHKSFPTPQKASEFFVENRLKLQIGMDFVDPDFEIPDFE